MPPLITLRLAIEAADEFITSREQRRAYISPDALRTYKIPAGSWVVLATGKKYAVLQLWPRASADIERMSTLSFYKALTDILSGLRKLKPLSSRHRRQCRHSSI
jgi:hypothetical protein